MERSSRYAAPFFFLTYIFTRYGCGRRALFFLSGAAAADDAAVFFSRRGGGAAAAASRLQLRLLYIKIGAATLGARATVLEFGYNLVVYQLIR